MKTYDIGSILYSDIVNMTYTYIVVALIYILSNKDLTSLIFGFTKTICKRNFGIPLLQLLLLDLQICGEYIHIPASSEEHLLSLGMSGQGMNHASIVTFVQIKMLNRIHN